MDTSLLSVQDRAQLEELLDQFDRALKECRGGRLPDVDSFLGDSQGHARDYLRREMESLWQDLVRGEYIKLRRIGGGGMGEVFLARHVKLGRQFALKEIKLECLQHSDRAEFEKRFKREVEACGRLEHHPNLVSVTNTGTSDSGVPYLVMEFVDGQDLKQIVERVGPLEIADACRIIHDAAAGLSHAHEMGLIHRDIKPSNIMVSKHGVVTVLDLGLARIIEGDRQATYVSTPGLVGSFDYMSPEQCREEFVIDARADVYSLGCTLYFLLAGRPPFADEKSIFQKLNAHQQHPLPPIERLREYDGLWQIVERMTAKEPADRFADLASVMMALRPYLGGSSLASLVAVDYQSLTRTRDDSGSTMRYTPGGGSRQGSGSKTVVGDTATSGSRRVSRRMFLTAAGATAAAGVAGGLTYLYTRPKPFTGPIALFLGTMPGLNGRWWFEETPWLLPELRMYLARSLADEPGALEEIAAGARSADVVAFHAQLRRYIDTARSQWPRDVTDRLSKLQNLDPETLGDDGLEEALSRMVESLETRRLTSGLSAVKWHELAILQHQRNEGESAVLAYEEAAQRYDAEGNRPLLALCLADWGQLRMRERRFVLAQEKFNSAREAVAKVAGDDANWTTWFTLDSLCNEGDAHRGFGNWEPALACLRQAAALAADASIDSEHPLRAVFHERCGWYHLDVWRPTAARDDFSQAKAIREANDRQGNPFALHFSYWNRQGNAMVDFLDYDRIEQARDALAAMLTPPSSGLRRKQYDQLKSRFPNLHERLADTGLVRADLKVDPVDELRKAIVAGEEEGFRDDGRWAHLVRLLFKSAVVTAFTSGRDDAKKQLETGRGELAQFQKSQTIQAVRTASGKRPQVYATSHELAAACVDWLDADAAAKERGRRALLAQLGRSTIEVARDDMLLLLYIGEQLVKSRSLSNEDRHTVSQKMIALTQIEPKAAAVDPKNTADAAAPALFLEYRRRAEAKS